MNIDLAQKNKRIFEQILKNSDEHKDKEIDYILYNKQTNDILTVASNAKGEMIQISSSNNKCLNIIEDDYNFDYYVYRLFEENYIILFMSDDTHCGIWSCIDDLYPDELDYKKGVKYYLKYCKDNNISKTYLDEKIGLDIPDIMRFY